MKVENYTLEVLARANHHVIDMTGLVAGKVAESGIENGTVCVFNVGSTAGITTVEYEPGLERDLETAFEKLAPSDAFYEHNERWHDGNGFSHIRATLLKPSLTIPVMAGRLRLGTWQQVVLINFDNRSRSRTVAVQVMGE